MISHPKRKPTINRTSIYTVVFALFVLFSLNPAISQTVEVGAGSYSLTPPAGELGPSTHTGQPAIPKISEGFDQPIQTTEFWSSLIFPFFGDPHSSQMYAHPFNMKAVGNGLQVGYSSTPTVGDRNYIFPFSNHFRLSASGLNVSETKTYAYSDWTVTAQWKTESVEMKTTYGHGLPFIFVEIENADAMISLNTSSSVWVQDDEVLGITIGGEHYAFFAPTGSQWSVSSSQLSSNLNGEGFYSVAILPDNTPETLEYFRQRAYAFVTNTHVVWTYDESAGTITNVYSYETTLMDSAEGNLNETLSALYRHQWLNVIEPLTNYTYNSPRGEMKVLSGNTFTTQATYHGILPSLPDVGNFDREEMLQLVQNVASGNLGGGPTYQNGKDMARFAHVIHIADQLGAENEKNQLMTKLKNRLENWLTVSGGQEYSYNETWNVMTGYPSDHFANTQINDHHFHHAYAIMSAATIARFDPEWASQENWGGMINLLVRDANSWMRDDEMFPFLRSFDVYAGHSWAAGHAAFADGNNQESSSEAMNFASAAILWGEMTNQTEIRDLGIFLYTTEAASIHQYWFDVDEEVFPTTFSWNMAGIVWSNKVDYSTWFGLEPEFIHGISILPVTSASLYLGQYPDYVISNFNTVENARNGEIEIWKDIFWKYLALADADRALDYLRNDPNYQRFDGNSRAHTKHWIHSLKELGIPDFNTTADIGTFAVFNNKFGDRTYVAYNALDEERTVNFSDGFSMVVEPRSMRHESITGDGVQLPINFDDESQDWNSLFVNFDGGMTTVVDNPNPGGINESQRVAEMVKNEGEHWAGSYIPLTEEIDISRPITVQVYAPRENTTLLLKIENDDDNSLNYEVNQEIPLSNEWVELTYDFSEANPEYSYNNIVFIFDLETVGDGSEDFTWYFDEIVYATDTSTEQEGEHPSTMTLNQNYPNPFNPTTQIQFSIPESDNVRLDVYTITGQLVANVVNGRVNSGSHTISFDGSALASGVYIYRLQTSTQTITRKMTLVK